MFPVRERDIPKLIVPLQCQYTNVPNQFLGVFPNGTIGEGPFREVRVLVDGRVAGVAFPYAVVFTGGIVPTAWRYVLPLSRRASANLRKLPGPSRRTVPWICPLTMLISHP